MRQQDETLMSRNEAECAVIDGQRLNILTLEDCVKQTLVRLQSGQGFTLFTLNLDHLVKRRSNPAFSDCYGRATFVTADGAPVAWLARKQQPGMRRTTGADLIVPLCFAAARAGMPVYLFGSSPETLDAASRALGRIPGLVIAGAEAPPQGFDPLSDAAAAAAARIAASGAKLAFIALGAPKQEAFSDFALASHPAIGFACIGAALDFLAGAQRRAPLLLRRTGMEWLWRLATNPRRLAARYWHSATLLAGIVAALLLRGPDNSIHPGE